MAQKNIKSELILLQLALFFAAPIFGIFFNRISYIRLHASRPQRRFSLCITGAADIDCFCKTLRCFIKGSAPLR